MMVPSGRGWITCSTHKIPLHQDSAGGSVDDVSLHYDTSLISHNESVLEGNVVEV